MPKKFVIIENTPGYLPEDDDPPTFETYASALDWLVHYNNELAAECDNDEGIGTYDVSAIVNGWFSYTRSDGSPYDLPRNVEIVPLEDDDG